MIFQDILPELDQLHLPSEWRTLFSAAGVPASALDDIQSTRTLINIVTHTVTGTDSGVINSNNSADVGENSPFAAAGPAGNPIRQQEDSGRASGVSGAAMVEKLDLGLLESDATYRKMDQEAMRASQAWSEIHLDSKQYIDSLDLTTDSGDTYGGPVESSGSLSTGTLSDTPPIPAPPPHVPPPPIVPHLSLQQPSMSSIGSAPLSLADEIKGGVNLKHVQSEDFMNSAGDAGGAGSFHLQAGQLLQQKEMLRPAAERIYDPLQSLEADDDGHFQVIASELQAQKGMLKSTFSPHPNQLTDLRAVEPEKLTDLADILRKVIAVIISRLFHVLYLEKPKAIKNIS